jgi:hypothetical protein
MITVDEVLDALSTAVDEYGADWVDPNARYGACENVYTTEEDSDTLLMCIGAKALAGLGCSVSKMGESSVNGGPIGDTIDHLGVFISSAGRHALMIAQGAQDSGQTWGAALREAKSAPRPPMG